VLFKIKHTGTGTRLDMEKWDPLADQVGGKWKCRWEENLMREGRCDCDSLESKAEGVNGTE
jgi:hypothetical protein